MAEITIRRRKPDIILTHWKGSIHKDHTAHRVGAVFYPENWEDLDGWQSDMYLGAGDVWDDYLKVSGTVRGWGSGFRKAIALMAPGARVWRMAYLPGLEPEQDSSPAAESKGGEARQEI